MGIFLDTIRKQEEEAAKQARAKELQANDEKVKFEYATYRLRQAREAYRLPSQTDLQLAYEYTNAPSDLYLRVAIPALMNPISGLQRANGQLFFNGQAIKNAGDLKNALSGAGLYEVDGVTDESINYVVDRIVRQNLNTSNLVDNIAEGAIPLTKSVSFKPSTKDISGALNLWINASEGLL